MSLTLMIQQARLATGGPVYNCMSEFPINTRVATRNPLMIPELFLNILECFEPTHTSTARRTLAALAQTCRTISEPSLNQLWWNLTSLQPLIRCSMGPGEVSLQNMVPPTSSQLAIIDRYAHRIRDVTISDKISVRFLQHTSMHSSPLLPNLMVLQWSPALQTEIHASILLIQRLLVPSLVSISVSLDEEDGTTLSFLDNYPFLCQNLKSIEFYFPRRPLSATITTALSRAICHQGALESVVVTASIDASALKHLSISPTLRKLSIHISECSIPPGGTFPLTDPLFCGVEELHFTTSDIHFVSRLLRPHEQEFHSFYLSHGDRLSSETIGDFLGILTSRSSTAEPLQRLVLSVGDDTFAFQTHEMETEAPRYRLSFKTLQPLMSLKSLLTFSIDWSEQVSLDNEELTSLASSWPQLEVFNISCGRGGYPPFLSKYPTLHGLLSLLDACPELYLVALPVDAREIPVVQETKVPKTNITALSFSESPICEARPVAEFLIKFLPSVRTVDVMFNVEESEIHESLILAYEHEWQQVDAHLAKIHFRQSDSATSDADYD